MRRLLGGDREGTVSPSMESTDVAALYLGSDRPPPAGRPWVTLSMVSSLDGATAVDGRSGGLGSPADKAIFQVIRTIADVILVGAGTVRAEGYGPPRLDAAAGAARAAAGRDSRSPRLAIVTASLDVDLSAPLFAGPDRVLVITTADADPARARAVGEVADIAAHGTGTVDLTAALADLSTTFGADVVVCEGGPSLNAGLAALGCIDEICMTISPVVAGGPSTRVVSSPLALDQRFRLDSLLEEGGMLFGRWVRA